MNPEISPRKSLGQHWLNDAASLQAVCAAAEVKTGDTVLEIGPGLGSLTRQLLVLGARVIAVELDHELATNLKTNLHQKDGPIKGDLTVVEEDILRFDFRTLPEGYKVAANIPYYLTSNLLRVLSECSNPPAVAALLVQKEVAERAAAQPGDMSILSVTAQFYWEVSLGQVVSAELFAPPPKVDSQILILKRRPKPLFENVDAKHFFRLVKAGFSQKRKTLENALSAGLGISKVEANKLLEKAGVDPQTRAQALSLTEWHSLYKDSLPNLPKR